MAGAEPEDESTDPPPTDQGGAPSPASDAASSSGEEAAPEPQPEPAPALAETPETAEAEAGECADDAASVATTAAAAAWLRERITVRGTWTKEHDAAVSAFLSPAGRRLLAYTDAVLGLCVTPALPQEVTEEIQYFVKRTAGSVDATNIARDVVVGSVRGGSLNSLLRLMSSVISPLCLAERTWPATIKKEFSGQLHRFMASLTEESWEARGQTVLYIPPEDASEPDVARHDKDLVLRLNTTLIHWTRQIKEVVNRETDGGDSKEEGPLAEVRFWSSRSVDLSGIHEQLERKGVRQVVEVLRAAKSSYLKPFLDLSRSIEEGHEEAVDNLRFLENLTPPCEALAAATPSEIPQLLPAIASVIRLIWRHSRFYNSDERLTALLRKVSNEIIARCRAAIDLSELLGRGDVKASMTALQQSIQAGEAWHRVYRTTKAAIAAAAARDGSGRTWDALDKASVFAQSDAFMQRCSDLLDVCASVQQLASRNGEGEPAALPEFGAKGGAGEVASSLLVLRSSFEKQLASLRALPYDILDVKASGWHDDYNRFKAFVKDLEVMLQNVIKRAFESAATTSAAVELLEAFASLAKRDAIRRCVEKQLAAVFGAFTQEVTSVKKTFDRLKGAPPLLHRDHPRYAGGARWAKTLHARVSRQWSQVESTRAYLAWPREAEEASAKFVELDAVLDEYVRRMYTEWVMTIESGLSRLLDQNLMVRSATPLAGSGGTSRERYTFVETSFDVTLLRLFGETRYWSRLGFEIPYVATDITNHADSYRVMRENVSLLARGFNSILASLAPAERKLFGERLHALEKKVLPGLTKLTWAAKMRLQTDAYLKEARRVCTELERVVTSFHRAKRLVAKACRKMSDTRLVTLRKKPTYTQQSFVEEQNAHHERVRATFSSLHAEMRQLLAESYEVFRTDGEEVQREWRRHVREVDAAVEEALRQTIKRSLLELSRAISGDKKTEVQPLFQLAATLQQSKVEFVPAINGDGGLSATVNAVCRDAISTTSAVPRLADALLEGVEELASGESSFFTLLSNEQEVLKTLVQVMGGMRDIQPRLQTYLGTWDRHKHIWDVDKDAFMRRYAKANRALTAYETDITRYKELQYEIQAEEGVTAIGFIRVDASPLKQALVAHCHTWQIKFTQLLNANAANELGSLAEHMASVTATFAQRPASLDQLAEHINLHASESATLASNEERFEPLETQYRLLDKFEVQVKEAELERLAGLRVEWESYKTTLSEASARLQRVKADFKEELVTALADFNDRVAEARAAFLAEGPFSADPTAEAAASLLSGFRKQAAAIRKQESDLAAGLQIFAIEQPANEETAQTERELDLLDAIWEMVGEWRGSMDGWKYGRFAEIDTASIVAAAQQFAKRVHKLKKEVKGWPVLGSLSEEIEGIKKLMPLISDMRNEAMRERHWAQLMEQVGQTFDPHASSFTLEKALELGLQEHEELIASLSTAAAKELAIEESIAKVEATWKELQLDIAEYKEEYLKLRSSEDVYSALEDNAVALSTMKSSRFAAAFLAALDKWEKTLSHISETVEALTGTQRKWMYLESIFVGSEDIRKQLPAESASFDAVNAAFCETMWSLRDAPSALAGCSAPGVLEGLLEMDEKLDRIQKSLDEYLETKRQAFPRFYFLSNDDLLEILGQARDPQAVQPHMRKCFEAIKTLDMREAAHGGKRGLEAVGIQAVDKEYVLLSAPVACGGPVESWLLAVEKGMVDTLAGLLFRCYAEMKKAKREKWIRDWAGMLSLAAGQIAWTAECTKALHLMAEGHKTAMRQARKKQTSLLNKLCDMVRGNLGSLDRKKVVNILTVEVHSREVLDKMVKAGCASVNDFEWLLQLRFYWEAGTERCVVRQTNTCHKFGYEYIGNPGRLVITPLTDRCYTTLTTALHLHRGGLPQGPAGTGKTETVKDLSKNLAKNCIVFNCSDGLDYKSLGRMFSGLAQTGAWSCFDEFNRIEVEVLSVVAQQILCILTAVTESKSRFLFEGKEIRLDRTCGIFVTMNPGYAGRSELPENLKALLRPMSMMAPDISLIIEIMLYAEGFTTSKSLAKKMTTLYHLMMQQLSKQDHYDFGLRSVKSVLNQAGALKRSDPEMAEDVILLRSIRDMNAPKFIAQDMPLFNALMSDLFPGTDVPTVDYGKLQEAIEEELSERGLQVVPAVVFKCIQTYESKLTRHGNMLVGPSLGGKSTVWNVLAAAMSRLRKAEVEGFQAVRPIVINPKAVPYANLYGEYDLQTFEWTDGVLAKVMRDVCSDERPDEKWLLMDGPVDTLWIESMNTVLDDNKLLTLINGERIAMPAQVSLLFEVEDLSVASPATVSRAGMVYVDASELGWRPFVDSWLAAMLPERRELLAPLVERALPRGFALKQRLGEPIPVADTCAARNVCRLFDALAPQPEADGFARLVELTFFYAFVWAFGATVDDEARKQVDSLVRELEPSYPHKDSVYEYYVDEGKVSWAHWEERLPASFRIAPGTPFSQILVPTVDTIRYGAVLSTLMRAGHHVMLTGDVGVGKTSIVGSALRGLGESFLSTVINFSARTSSTRVSDDIEAKVEKRTKDTWAPPGGKKLVVFIDDFNMPEKEVFSAQPPLELLRQWLQYSFWYDLKKQTPKYVRDAQLVAGLGHPGGGRTSISARTTHCFHVLNLAFPAEAQVRKIFGTLVNSHLSAYGDEIRPTGDLLVGATYEIYVRLCAELLPTPDKPHYTFNLRDISRVVEGVLQPVAYDSREGVARLWAHECYRVFGDRLTNDADRESFAAIVSERCAAAFGQPLASFFDGGAMTHFCDFMGGARADGDKGRAPYEEVTDRAALKKLIEERLDDYNEEPGVQRMDLVCFSDAIAHVCRIKRVIAMPRGHAMLVGVGGSGRQSLARLASYLADFRVFTIEVVRGYKSELFREDLKKLYDLTGLQQTDTVFLFNDTQVIENSFLEDINGMLTAGEVSGLYPPDEASTIREAVRGEVEKAGLPLTNDSMWSFFIERVRARLHVVLCMSPVGDSFRNYVRMFPALVSCTTIDWFSEWPADALKEVALKFLEEVQIDEAHLAGVSSVFATTQQSVLAESRSMLARLGRHNYVTPTNYLELVKGYCKLLGEKRATVGDQAFKLKNGLQKLSDTSAQVAEMSVELEQKKKVVAKATTDCEEMLLVIVQEKRVVDEQEKIVNAEAEKIQQDEVEVRKIAEDAQADLDKAIPALEAAQAALDSLNKKDMSEIKAYAKPPPAVEMVLEAVMVLRKAPPTWAEAKKQLGDANFLGQLVNYDKEALNDAILTKVNKYTKLAEFDPESVGGVSKAAKSLCMWVRAMEVYGRVAKDVAPKRAKLAAANKTLSQKQAQLAESQAKVKEISDRVAALRDKYTTNVDNKEKLKAESEQLESMLERATQLVDGLGGERARWEVSIGVLETSISNLVGDCLLAAAFLSYCGPFDADYRQTLLQGNWMKAVHGLAIPCSADFDFCTFLANPEDVRDWNIQGLPADAFSTENGVTVTRGSRWPLMIDPQEQANRWIRNMEKENGLKVVTLKQSDYLRTLENAIAFGQPVLLQEVEEELDPSLEPIMSRAVVKVGNRSILKLGDKEVDYNPEFRFYLTTKLANPHYTPEISTKACLVNFCVKQQGLEDQLLGIVVRKERPDLEAQKNELVVAVAAGKRKLVELEDTILRMLSEASGSLLEDEALVLTLQSSKTTSVEVEQQLAVSEQTEAKIDAAREGYRPCAYRASILYFVLSDLARVDPMYQFSLDAYVGLFDTSLAKSAKSDELPQRIASLNEYHTYFVYRSTCRALFETHKLLFSFQICAKILLGAGKMDAAECDFFLRGGQVFDKSAQPQNPSPDWLSEAAWDHVTELDKLPAFRDIVSSFGSANADWHEWCRHPQPEAQAAKLPGEWETRCSEMQRLILVRCLRPDRIVFAATAFIVNNLGTRFTEPPVLDLTDVLADSAAATPLIFVLSPGVDPTNQLTQLAQQREVTFHSIALGQGQSPHALRLIDEGVREGHWVLLANCHLMMSWLGELDKIVEGLPARQPHASFRLWLSSSPHPAFPIGILQRGIKMTTEPPKGLKANMTRLIQNLSETRFSQCTKPHKYKKLLFAMCWFHSLLVDRRKFGNLGWNIPYDFNDSDFEVSELCLRLYLDEYEETPWEALKYLIAEINYGGRVTDDRDRRLMNVYMDQFFCDETLDTPAHRLSSLPDYVVPEDGPLRSYLEACAGLPQADRPEAFGQHPNADIASQIEAGNSMLEVIVSLQPRAADGGGATPDDRVYALAGDLLELVPEACNIGAKAGESDGSAMHVVLVQELQRYNKLLAAIRLSLADVRKGIRGLVVMSAELDDIFQRLLVGAVPPSWLSAYPSLKPLASWARDLIQRWQQLMDWCDRGMPTVFWLAGFTYPTGFLTALMQTAARENTVSVDSLSWDFPIVGAEEASLTERPKDGAYVKGLFLEGAGWQHEEGCLCEPAPMQLIDHMPIVHFRPVETRRSKAKGVYSCPLYLYPLRTGSRERPSFMLNVDLKSGAAEPEAWVKRGTALLLALAS